MRVAGDDDVDRVAHLPRFADDLAARLRRGSAGLEGARVGEHHDRLDALLLKLGHVPVHGVGEVEPAVLARVAAKEEDRCRGRRHADEPDLHSGALDDPVGREDRLAGSGLDRVRGDVREVGAADQAQHLRSALVELVVAHGPHVEAHQVERLDRGLVLEVAGDEGGGADHVARMDPDRGLWPARLRAVQMGAEVRGAAERAAAELRRLEMAVEVVHAEQADVDPLAGHRAGVGEDRHADAGDHGEEDGDPEDNGADGARGQGGLGCSPSSPDGP